MRVICLMLVLAVPAAAGAQLPDGHLPMAASQLTPEDRESILAAAGYERRGDAWTACEGNGEVHLDDQWVEGGAVRDLNGDGRPEAIAVDTGTACHGMTGQGYAILTAGEMGWELIDAGSGMPRFLDAKGADGWPDLEVGGPGFCFPVMRWNGSEYALDRFEYEGKACMPEQF